MTQRQPATDGPIAPSAENAAPAAPQDAIAPKESDDQPPTPAATPQGATDHIGGTDAR